MILHSELKHQRKLVRSLKKKSLWAKSLEEVYMIVVLFINFEKCPNIGDLPEQLDCSTCFYNINLVDRNQGSIL